VNKNWSLKVLIFSVATLLAAPSFAQLSDGVIRIGFGEGNDTIASMFDSGYRIDQEDMSAPYVITPLARKIFSQNAGLRPNLPAATPMVFLPLVQDVARFIVAKENERHVNTEAVNGISNWALAIRITRLAFCFGTDPRGIAAQIQIESSFDRTKVSHTGAVGFTQMTSAAIDEVNDQLGNRNGAGSRVENYLYLYQAIRCYMGGRRFKPMFFDGTIPRGKLVAKNPRLRTAAKNWIRGSIDRELIYGQITLKTLLAHARSQGLKGEAAYREAFRRYNGEPGGAARTYSREILNSMKGST
jgi:hypothetical protein